MVYPVISDHCMFYMCMDTDYIHNICIKIFNNIILKRFFNTYVMYITLFKYDYYGKLSHI